MRLKLKLQEYTLPIAVVSVGICLGIFLGRLLKQIIVEEYLWQVGVFVSFLIWLCWVWFLFDQKIKLTKQSSYMQIFLWSIPIGGNLFFILSLLFPLGE